MLPLVIVNPKSAGGSTRDNWSAIASDLRTHFGPFQVAFTKAAGDGARLAKDAAQAGRKFIIACGGDGTINEVANGIIESGADTEFGVLPSGTGGDFRRSLGIPNSPREAARAIRNGKSKLIDVGRITFQSHADETVSRYFLNVSSFGLAASIIERVKSNKALDWLPLGGVRGRASFALSTLQEVVGLDPVTVRVKIDDGEERLLQTVNFCVANARYFGGGMMIAPDAKLDDGCFDLVNIGDIRTAKILLNAFSLYNGTHVELKEVKSTLAKRISVSPSDPQSQIHLETDGELPGKLPAVYEVVPNALRVRVPINA
ncbi:MAG: diacylglycerol kinase family lipid kinase [Acidobacteria bacterium]|nr:diacylglycerol kinase family lipid kinase [Acidobacteriota bacterium]